jgi:hypothetical protein
LGSPCPSSCDRGIFRRSAVGGNENGSALELRCRSNGTDPLPSIARASRLCRPRNYPPSATRVAVRCDGVREMSLQRELPVAQVPPLVQPFEELPSLVLADPTCDVRGCEVRSVDGRLLGRVSDLLVDPDRLRADFVVISSDVRGEADVPVSLSSLERRSGFLVLGRGTPTIELRYRSTTHLVLWAAAAVLLFVVAWLI